MKTANHLFLLVAGALALLLFRPITADAGSATWKSSPATGDWNTATNWTPQTVPNGPSDVATFAISNQTAVSLSAQTEVNGITFNSGASAFTITVPANTSGFTLNITGVGVTNDSGTTQTIVANEFYQGFVVPMIQFSGSARAGGVMISYEVSHGAVLVFSGSSSAQNANFTADDGVVQFNDASTAGNAKFTLFGEDKENEGPSGTVNFAGSSSADNAVFTLQYGGTGSTLTFTDNSSGGTATVIMLGAGDGSVYDAYLVLYDHDVSIGSLEGDGSVRIGNNRLTVGTNQRSTTFSGVIGGTDLGSLRKVGSGTFTLAHPNLFGGGTTIGNGSLIATNKGGSATGSGPVQVNSGTLGGTGIISGAVTVGNGTRTGAKLQPGIGTTAGTLTINNTASFNPRSAFKCNVSRSTTPLASKLKALGVTIGTNVSFKLLETGTTALSPGTVFTVISNTSANPISGTFSNLPDGGTITTSSGTTYKANYSGGDGNNLTLTVQ